MPGRVYDQIFDIAADQFGYVTTAQARLEGVDGRTLVMMAQRGALDRISRGVYRLSHFPETRWDHFMAALMWSTPTPAVLSHESALEVFEISDVNPQKVHVTVPSTYRVRRQVPPQLIVHRADLGEGDKTVFRGLTVTSPERTIRDCHDAAMGRALVSQAISDAEREGLISRKTAGHLRELTS